MIFKATKKNTTIDRRCKKAMNIFNRFVDRLVPCYKAQEFQMKPAIL